MCVRAHNGHLRDYALVGWYIIEVLCIMAVSNFDFITHHSLGITSTFIILYMVYSLKYALLGGNFLPGRIDFGEIQKMVVLLVHKKLLSRKKFSA